jgi:hypothetical protein
MNAEPAFVERTKLSLKPRRNCTAGDTSEPKVAVAIIHFGGTQPVVVVLVVTLVVPVVVAVVVVPWMMSVSPTVSVVLPGGPVPIIVTITMVEAAFCATARDSTETVEPPAGGVTGLGAKVPDTPAGNEATARFT